MNLINDAEWNEINSALRDVTDTFHRLPIDYVVTKNDMNLMQSDAKEKPSTTYQLQAYVDPEDKTATKDSKGVIDFNGATLQLNYDYLNELGLTQPPVAGQNYGEPKMNTATDIVVIRGVKYRVDGVSTDGQLKDKPVLVYVKLRKFEKNG